MFHLFIPNVLFNWKNLHNKRKPFPKRFNSQTKSIFCQVKQKISSIKKSTIWLKQASLKVKPDSVNARRKITKPLWGVYLACMIISTNFSITMLFPSWFAKTTSRCSLCWELSFTLQNGSADNVAGQVINAACIQILWKNNDRKTRWFPDLIGFMTLRWSSTSKEGMA
jgi:hypothetical protein